MVPLLSSLLLTTALLPGGQPPADLAHGRTLDRIELVADGRLVQGTPGYDLAKRRVWVTYAATSTGVHPRAQDARTVEEATGFWPTAVAVLDEEHLAVGGRFAEPSEPATVVEVWRLRRPRVEVDLRGVARLVGLGVVERTRIYTSTTPGRDMVRTLVRLRGRPGTLLAQFHDSGDVVELEYGPVRAAGPWRADDGRVVLTARPQAGALYVPALVNRALVEVSVQETRGGFTYTLRPPPSLRLAGRRPGPEERTLRLIDSNGDGAIDAWRTPGTETSTVAQRRPLR
jgi:hypothetical protein